MEMDLARFGVERLSFTPRQADVLICAGRVSYKMAPVLRKIWDQMPQPKWSIAMGACASTGGVFDTYSIVQGIDTITGPFGNGMGQEWPGGLVTPGPAAARGPRQEP